MIKVFVMHTCPDCKAVKAMVKDDQRFQLIDIGEHVRNMKEFMQLRDNNPAFDTIKNIGVIGIPCFLMENGSVTFSLADVKLPEIESGASCNLDGKGC
jgi:glutaredoxin-related protein